MRKPNIRIATDGYLAFGRAKIHIEKAEQALKMPLPKGAQVHHADGDKLNNDNHNLVICPNQAYHHLLHIRLKAFFATGNPDLRRCPYCQKWDEPGNMHFQRGEQTGSHRACDAKRSKEYRDRTGYRRPFGKASDILVAIRHMCRQDRNSRISFLSPCRYSATSCTASPCNTQA